MAEITREEARKNIRDTLRAFSRKVDLARNSYDRIPLPGEIYRGRLRRPEIQLRDSGRGSGKGAVVHRRGVIRGASPACGNLRTAEQKILAGCQGYAGRSKCDS